MSFLTKSEHIKAGDTVFIVINFAKMYPLKIKEGEVFQTKFGPLRHSELIGIKYGSKFTLAKGWVYLLSFTPELWTMNLPHRTQILYSTDISLITMKLNLKPGSIVVESGTGSGSLSHAIIRTIAPHGTLHTFDFHEERVKKAIEEFEFHGVSSLVRAKKRDVCEEGFDLSEVADAVFLDIPYPWRAINFAWKALKPHGARICCFSPCIEQVQKTRAALEASCFIAIETLECLHRPFLVKNMMLKNFATQDTSSPIEKEQDLEVDVDVDVDVELDSSSLAAAQSATDYSKKANLKLVPAIEVTGHTGFLTFGSKI